MEFKEAYKAAKFGEFIRPDPRYHWRTIDVNGCWIDENDVLAPADWSLKFYACNRWEVKQKEIFVWGVSKSDGDGGKYNHIFRDKPTKIEGEWCKTLTSSSMYIGIFGDFPTDKPQKYRLVHVEKN